MTPPPAFDLPPGAVRWVLITDTKGARYWMPAFPKEA